MIEIPFYNPEAIVENTIDRALTVTPFPLQPIMPRGGGVYLLFYNGDNPMYQSILSPDALYPIYVGQSADNVAARVRVHCQSLDEVWNLDRAHFQIKVLSLPPSWAFLTESELRKHFNEPWWNRKDFYGFGNNSSRRIGGKASAWDIFHPGRRVALKLKRPPDAEAKLKAEMAVRKAKADNEDLIMDLFGNE